jgi:hypothetical protein
MACLGSSRLPAVTVEDLFTLGDARHVRGGFVLSHVMPPFVKLLVVELAVSYPRLTRSKQSMDAPEAGEFGSGMDRN